MTEKAKTERLGLRISPDQRALLDEASQVEGTTITEFVLSHSTQAAEQLLANRQHFEIPERRLNEFLDALDRPSRKMPKLRALVNSPTVTEK